MAVPGAWLQACNDSGQCRPNERSNASGDYRFKGLVDGTYRLRVFPPAGSSLNQAFRSGVTILPPNRHLIGVDIELTEAAAPPPGVSVNANSGVPRRHVKDVDGDGDLDLVFHFRLGDTGLTCNSTEGTLTGQTFGGAAIEGTDALHMVGG